VQAAAYRDPEQLCATSNRLPRRPMRLMPPHCIQVPQPTRHSQQLQTTTWFWDCWHHLHMARATAATIRSQMCREIRIRMYYGATQNRFQPLSIRPAAARTQPLSSTPTWAIIIVQTLRNDIPQIIVNCLSTAPLKRAKSCAQAYPHALRFSSTKNFYIKMRSMVLANTCSNAGSSAASCQPQLQLQRPLQLQRSPQRPLRRIS